MLLSPKTLTILKNFAAINDRILIDPGNEICVVAKNKAVLGQGTVAENFPTEIRLYSLSNFLSVVGLFKVADCDFQDGFARIREADGDAEVRYLYAGPSCMNDRPPKKLARLPPQCIEFDLPEAKLAALQKAASVLEKKEIRILSDGHDVSITTYNHKNPGGHEFSTPLAAEPHGVRCNAIFQLDNLKLMKGSYHATVARNFTVFKSTSDYDLTYWIGCDPESAFG